MRVTVDLQEGFLDDTVVLRVDGREILREKVRTKMQTGLGRHVEVDVAPGSHALEVELPDRNEAARLDLVVRAPHYVGVSLAGGKLAVVEQGTPFMYA